MLCILKNILLSLKTGVASTGFLLVLQLISTKGRLMNIADVFLGFDTILQIMLMVTLILFFVFWSRDISTAMHLLGWIVFIAYLDFTFQLGRLEVCNFKYLFNEYLHNFNHFSHIVTNRRLDLLSLWQKKYLNYF